jgi:Cof subfamily protein (haloacid dehalogenase superfamily)
MEYKAIITDIDGTLAPVALKSVPSKLVKNAIQKTQNKGVFFSLATGKPFSLVEYLIDELKLTAPIIVDNGAALYDPRTKKPILDFVIDNDEASQLLKFIIKNSKEYRLSCRKGNLHNCKELPQNDVVRKFIILDLPLGKTDVLIKELESHYKNLHIVKTSSDLGKEYNAIYISSGNATKQHAVLKFAEILGISTQEIIGIGDHYNDFPLLMACGLRVAMGNAVPELKAIADYIAPTVEEDGLAHVLNKFILEK